MSRAMVLLSGGLDSVAVLHWALRSHKREHVRAIGFRYGQRHEAQEMGAAIAIASRRGVPFEVVDLSAAFFGILPEPVAGLNLSAPEGAGRNTSRANIPARNAVMLSIAAARAVARWPGESIALVGGWNFDDKMGFPDCRPGFLDAMGAALALAVDRIARVKVVAPWQRWPKFQIVDWCKTADGATEDIAESVSCYYGTACGSCDACRFRATAFRLAEDIGAPIGIPRAT